MERNYKETHESILKSAKENFLEKGFERSNLREICRGANVTTGAFYKHFNDKQDVFCELVKPVIVQLEKIFSESEKESYIFLDEKKTDLLWDVNKESILFFVDFICKNMDEFKLLLSSSDGTPYENFIHILAEIETFYIIKFINKMKEKGYEVRDISENEIHILTQAYFTSIFEIIIHDYTEEEREKCIDTVIEFNTMGWRSILKI